MPRSPRIEFEGAVYHVMARGNRRELIVFDNQERQLFMQTFSEACSMTGWEVFAWVLLDNHYHAVFRAPKGNLVEGMKWFQNAYTRRLNVRHRLWGHLFGGRYRSILIEDRDYGGAVWRDYLRTVIDYVHLNPGRANLVDLNAESSADYPWSSLAQGHLLPPSKRPSWLATAEMLDLYQYKDTPKGRVSYLEHIDEWLSDGTRGEPGVDEMSFEQRVKRGWYWGSEAFKEAMLEKVEKLNNRTYKSSPQARDHSKADAEAIICEALDHFQITEDELQTTKKGDLTRAAIAWRIFYETTLSQTWIADRLQMKSAPNVCRQIRVFKEADKQHLPKKMKQWTKRKNF